MKSIKGIAPLALATLLFLGGCSSGDNGNGPDEPQPFSLLRLDLYDTAELPDGFAYQLWLLPNPVMRADASAWEATVQFRTISGEEGQPDTLVTLGGQKIPSNTFSNLSVDFSDYDSLLITIEDDGSLASTPSQTLYLLADIPADLDLVSIAGLEFPTDVSGRSGYFALMSPTDADSLNENSGLWFLRPFQPPQPGLSAFPVAPAGWNYEGWVRHAGTWLSTGTFTNPVGPDDFDGYSASVNAPPAFPGEDFLVNAPAGVTFPWVLVDSDSVAVTLEPDPDPSPGEPFEHRFLLSSVGDPAKTLTPVENSLPAGNADFNRPDSE